MMCQTIPPEPLTTPHFKSQLNKCIHCGLCPSACPTYMAAGTEMNAPRGRLALLRAVCAGRIPLSETVGRYIYDCLGCQSCRVACPSGVNTEEIFATVKQLLAQSEFFPTPLADLAQRVHTTHNISGEPAQHRLLWMENLDVAPQAVAERQSDVVLFTGCVSALYPTVYGILQSMVNLLRAAKVSFTMLGSEEWCCGYPLLSAGLDVGELMAYNLARIKGLGAHTLVTTCPSCYYMWKNHYVPDSFRVVHAAEFLLEFAQAGTLALPPLHRRVTYHDPCDLGRKSKVYEAPRQLIQAIPGVQFVEMKANRDNALCCGGGGNLETLDVELSRAVAKLRLEQARDVGAEVIVSACQQCERTLASAARRERAKTKGLAGIKVMDITQLLGEATSL